MRAANAMCRSISEGVALVKIKSMPVQFKAGPDEGLGEGEFIVYPSTFTREPDAYGDVVAKGAFARGIAARKDAGISLPGLFGHRMDDPEFFVAHAISEEEDDHGWRVHGVFDLENPKARATYRLVKGGRLRELSFAYDVLDGAMVKLEDGRDAYELRDMDVFEYSFVPVGANRDTSVVAVKSAVDGLVDGLKAGRVISAKNESELRTAYEAIGNVLSALGTDDDGKASGTGAVKFEEPAEAKNEEPGSGSSVLTRLQIELATAEFGDL